jgi:hypothetical protein
MRHEKRFSAVLPLLSALLRILVQPVKVMFQQNCKASASPLLVGYWPPLRFEPNGPAGVLT